MIFDVEKEIEPVGKIVDGKYYYNSPEVGLVDYISFSKYSVILRGFLFL